MKRIFLLFVIVTIITSAYAQDSEGRKLPQQPKLFVLLPDICPTPDGMAVSPEGDLILACPNFADISKSACIMRINKKGIIRKWFDVPVLKETGLAAPMGITFGDNGELYICDNQGWSGNEKAQQKGRVLKIEFDEDNKVSAVTTIALGMEHPNGIRFRNGKLYVTQSMLPNIKDESGLMVSGVYMFDKNDKEIKISNSNDDKHLIATVITQNKDVQYGLDGIVFDNDGNLYVGNFGDGAIHKIIFDDGGNVADCNVWAKDLSQLRTTDGMCIDKHQNIWVADFSENAIAKVDRSGKITRVAQSPDCDGSDGGLDQPREPIIWMGNVIISCFDIVIGPDKVNTKHDKPYTLVKLKCK